MFRRLLVVAMLGSCLPAPIHAAEDDTAIWLQRIMHHSAEWERFRTDGTGLWQLDHLEEELNSSGRVVESDHSIYQVIRLEGRSYHSLITRNGKPLSAKEQREQEQDKRKFLDAVRASRRTGKPFEETENHVRFDQGFLDRYTFKIVGHEERDGFPCVVIAFNSRKDSPLTLSPTETVRRRLQGRIWLHEEDGAVIWLEANLPEPVSIGLVAIRVEKVHITFGMQKIPSGQWGPRRFEITVIGRALFSRLDRHALTQWTFQ